MDLAALLLDDVAALEERLDDVGSCRGASDTILLHRLTELFLLDELTRGLHSTQECRFGVVLRGLGLLLAELGDVLARLAFGEGREECFGCFSALFAFLGFARLGGCLGLEDHTPPWLEDFLPRGLELYLACCALDTRRTHEAVGVEGGDEVAGDEVEDLRLRLGEPRGRLPCGDDSVVVGDLLVVKDLLALADGGATEEWAHQIEIGWDDEASQDTCDLRI